LMYASSFSSKTKQKFSPRSWAVYIFLLFLVSSLTPDFRHDLVRPSPPTPLIPRLPRVL
jgi:hypothetical protein